MHPQNNAEVAERSISAAELHAIKETLAAHATALVAAAHTTRTGTLIAEVRQDMTFLGAQVVPDDVASEHAPGPAPVYRVRVCRIVAWRPWAQREVDTAIAAIESTAIAS